MSNQTTKIASVIMHHTPMQRVVHHLLVDFINAACNGFDQSSSTDNGIKI